MVKRRTVLLGGGATAGALVIGWGVMPPRQRLHTAQRLPPAPGQVALNGWLKVDADNTVTVMMAKSEMGQGTHTGLAAILAEELDADWAQVRLEMAPIDDIYNNLATVVDGLPFHPDNDGTIKAVAGWLTAKTMREVGVMMTGGSSSIKDLWQPMREAGAHARALLISAAAAQWKVQAAECTTNAGWVEHAAGQRATFGELAAIAAQQPLPGKVTLKKPAAFKLIGKPLKRIEAASKLNGTAVFGIDANPPGLLHASVVMCPTRGGKVARFDGAAAQALPGVKKVLAVPPFHGGTGAVAVIADTPWHAKKAAAAVTVEWDHGPAATLSSAAVMTQLVQALDQAQGFGYHSVGDVDTAMQAATTTLTADYHAPYLAHAAMEPINCTAQFKDGTATVWTSTQVPGLARMAAAKALGIDDNQVTVHQLLLGGGFGRRLEVDYVAQAAAIARAADGAPVQTLWSREQDTQHDFYRPACVARFKAGLDAQGQLVAWHNVSAGQAIVPQVLARTFGLPGAGPDKTTSEGAFDQPYEWPHARIAHEIIDLPLPVGFWRSVGHSHQAFFKESFVDEAAHAVKQDPVAFRAALLQKHPRHLRVLKTAAELAGWGTPLAANATGTRRARGIALHQSFGSIVAQVAEVSVGPDKALRVHRVVCVIDCGAAVNPNLITQQMESAVVFGLTAAVHGEVTIKDGQVQQSNLHDYPLLRMADCPQIETHIIASAEPPEGVGEPGVPPIAPAVANAVFALTGQRLRALPLKLS
ncbi:isoquinoline 1-oxidoreductase beta subunit [Acidovorax sp. 69]|uniref:xanthine dehydrogenase family protein molybdopterin-binding subunit n=1 Tax=Acidovorax sp. 69 TaxID=2035202 RepID=UPI000C236A2D|nr:xanthine dehydrogenase family protein molybdopterin-binding subunit [Acidovorax sp. 69]PJI98815.1 isoquinoline 1-oxidoreductase beta subunit [Acidovorax sp. 69]